MIGLATSAGFIFIIKYSHNFYKNKITEIAKSKLIPIFVVNYK